MPYAGCIPWTLRVVWRVELWICKSSIFPSFMELAAFTIMQMRSRALYKLILLDSATTAPAEQNPTFVSTIRVKLSKRRTAIVKLESNKPLIVDPDGKLVNTHDHHSYNCPSSQEGNKIDTITLHPTMNLRDGQRMDSHLAYIIDLKTRKLPRPNLTQIKNPTLKKWLKHCDQYFLHV